MWKKYTTRCLGVVRFLPIVPCFPHTYAPTSSETVSLKILTIYLHNINQKPIISPSTVSYLNSYTSSIPKVPIYQKYSSYPKDNFSHENSPPFIISNR